MINFEFIYSTFLIPIIGLSQDSTSYIASFVFPIENNQFYPLNAVSASYPLPKQLMLLFLSMILLSMIYKLYANIAATSQIPIHSASTKLTHELTYQIEQNNLLEKQLASKNQQLIVYLLHSIEKQQKLKDANQLIKQSRLTKKLVDIKKIYTQVIHLLDYSLRCDKDWDQVYQIFEKVSADFYQRLKQLYPSLSIQDLYYCALLKAKVPIAKITDSLGITFESLRAKHRRIDNKIQENAHKKINESMSWFKTIKLHYQTTKTEMINC